VSEEAVQAIHRWLFGDEAEFLAGIEMRLEAGARMVERGDLTDFGVVHPDTGELVLITREDILKHAEADDRALEPADRYGKRGRNGTGA
jgi:hypothetical protein